MSVNFRNHITAATEARSLYLKEKAWMGRTWSWNVCRYAKDDNATKTPGSKTGYIL